MPENPESEGSRLITLKQIELEHGVSRSALHTYRRSASFPQPVPVEGSTKTQYRAEEVAAWFQANPKQQGKKRDQFVSHQQGDPVTITTARDRLAETLKSPGLVGFDDEEADQLLDAYRAAVLREGASAVNGLSYHELRGDFEYSSQRDAWDGGTLDAAAELRRMADEAEAPPASEE